MTTTIDEAKTIVNNIYQANDVILTDVLTRSVGTNSRGQKVYRPYWTAAFLIITEYRRIKKADDVTFEYNEVSIKGLLALQDALDDGLTIPLGMGVDDLLESVTDINFLGMIVI